MKTLLFWLFFLGLLLFLTNYFLRKANAREFVRESITFVASENELSSAWKNQTDLKGIAVRFEFYKSAPPDVKKKIKELANALKNTRPVLVYGFRIDVNVLIEITAFEKVVAFKGEYEKAVALLARPKCNPTLLAGIFATIEVNSVIAGYTNVMCVRDEYDRTEEWLREYILKFWEEEKEYLRNIGYAVPPPY